MAPTQPLVMMRGITKTFAGRAANDDIDLDLAAGEIHALLGENGAGKSTLMNILSGLYRADRGTVSMAGRRLRLFGPRDAIAAGIGMVHQHFMLVKGHTVAENVILGSGRPRFLLRRKAVHGAIADLAERFHIHIDVSARVWQLSIGERQRVEILKLLYRDARVLILDEPTSVLTPPEVEHLFVTLRELKASGRAIVFISHKLDEVMRISDRITVLRDGRTAASVMTESTTPEQLAETMFGKAAAGGRELPVGRPSKPSEVLRLEKVCARSDRGLMALKDVDLTVGEGEIFGILGIAGNGQKELAEAVAGLRRPAEGRIIISGRDLTGKPPGDFINSGVAHIPEDRLGMGLASSLSLAENMALKDYRRGGRAGFFVRPAVWEARAERAAAEYGIIPRDSRAPAGLLSGGNIQRLILARELSGKPRLLVASCPFQGLDVAATEFIAGVLRQKAREGLAILLIGEDMDLTLALSTTVAVMYEGVLHGIQPAATADFEEMGLLMAGQGCAEARP